MSDEENALVVFTRAFAPVRRGASIDWSISFDEEEAEKLGLTWEALDIALQLLVDVGLIEPHHGPNSYWTTDLGRQAGRDVGIAREAIYGVSETAPAGGATIFNMPGATFHGPTVAGPNAVQHNTFTYTNVLQNVVEAIEKADIPHEEKAGVLKSLGAALESKTGQRILDVVFGAGASAGAHAMLKEKLGLK